MKKTSIFLAVAMLVTALVPLLVFGASAVSAGDVSASVDSSSAYYYADDASAKQNGAIAKFTRDDVTHYVKDLAAVFAFGGNTTVGADTVTMIADTVALTSQNVLTAKGSFTLVGNGCTITGSALSSGPAIRIVGVSKDHVVTIDGLKIALGTTKNVASVEVATNNASTPVTVVLKNTSIESTSVSNEVVSVRAHGKLVLDSGSTITTAANNPWNIQNGSVAIVMSANSELVINDGATVSSKGNTIVMWDGTTNASLTINGGSISSTNGEAVIALCTTVINGGTIQGNTVLTAKGPVTINGGTFIANTLAAVAASYNAVVDIKGGLFTTAKEGTTLNWDFGVVTSGIGAGHPGATVNVYGGTFRYFNANDAATILKSNVSKDGQGVINVYGGSFVGSKYVFNGNKVDGTGGVGSITLDSVPKAVKGASVRTAKDESGIRFRSTLEKGLLDYVDSVKKEGTTPVFGTVIAPADYVDAAGVFTMAALENASLDAAADKRYVNIVAKNGIETDTDGNITLSAALIDIHESNYTRNFAAVAYVSYETENGTMIIYGDYDDSKSSRNIREIAYSALEDVSETAVEGYQTAVTEWYAYEESAWVKKTGTAYSCYSKAQLEVIKAYIA